MITRALAAYAIAIVVLALWSIAVKRMSAPCPFPRDAGVAE
jgi:hypothetical protein